ncbi:hypothetical protein H4582DRAFT_2051312 [Lactarius indigo]|nr:hypothetical protein H4582DRAFT_2051312 [Lactarius indigo]
MASVHPFRSLWDPARESATLRKHDPKKRTAVNGLEIVSRLDLAQHPCVLVVDVKAGPEKWRVVTFYNDVEDRSALATLMRLDFLWDGVPTLLVGDFNLHSRLWSPVGWQPSPQAASLASWASAQTLELLNIPGVPTRRGTVAQNQRDSMLDLCWRNFAAVAQGTFQGAMVDWEGSVGSDHALVCTLACTHVRFRGPREDATNGFSTDLDDDGWAEWRRLMELHSPVLHGPLRSPAEIDTVLDRIYDAFNEACGSTMKRKGRNAARAAPWWNAECAQAAADGSCLPPPDQGSADG